MCELSSKFTRKALKRRHSCCSDFFIFKFEQISHIFLKFQLLLLTSKCWLGYNSYQNQLYFKIIYPKEGRYYDTWGTLMEILFSKYFSQNVLYRG